jgi:hypothetical protein
MAEKRVINMLKNSGFDNKKRFKAKWAEKKS